MGPRAGHAVAKCPACDQSFRQQQLGSDLLGHRTHLCPCCRADVLIREAEAATAALRETMERVAEAQTVVGMPDEPRLREQAREAILNGRLPARPIAT